MSGDDGVPMRERSLPCMTAASSTLTLPPPPPPAPSGTTDESGTPAAQGISALPSPPVWPALTVGLHRIAYTEWGDPDAARVVVCVHGFTRNGRDFDVLARHLGRTRRVVCPDLPGRGRSDWLAGAGPDGGYNQPQYLLDLTTLLARLDVEQVDWIGTSMGGLAGLLLAALPGSPIRRLVLNDVGALVPGAFLDEISRYIGADPGFGSLEEAEAYLRALYPGFGDLTDEQWAHLARHGTRTAPDGRLHLAYDPAVARTLAPPHADQSLWPFWEAVRCPVLLLRGERSPALPADVARRMTVSGPHARLVEIPGCGHAPALMSPGQLALVEAWLDEDET